MCARPLPFLKGPCSCADGPAGHLSWQFSVPGKPNPPPVPLKASLGTFEYPSSGVEGAAANKRATILFTDPSGTMAEPYYPLDAWVAAARS